MIDELLLLSGNDIPFPEARLTIHQPRLKEIAYITEPRFWFGCELLKFDKSIFKSYWYIFSFINSSIVLFPIIILPLLLTSNNVLFCFLIFTAWLLISTLNTELDIAILLVPNVIFELVFFNSTFSLIFSFSWLLILALIFPSWKSIKVASFILSLSSYLKGIAPTLVLVENNLSSIAWWFWIFQKKILSFTYGLRYFVIAIK